MKAKVKTSKFPAPVQSTETIRSKPKSRGEHCPNQREWMTFVYGLNQVEDDEDGVVVTPVSGYTLHYKIVWTVFENKPELQDLWIKLQATYFTPKTPRTADGWFLCTRAFTATSLRIKDKDRQHRLFNKLKDMKLIGISLDDYGRRWVRLDSKAMRNLSEEARVKLIELGHLRSKSGNKNPLDKWRKKGVAQLTLREQVNTPEMQEAIKRFQASGGVI